MQQQQQQQLSTKMTCNSTTPHLPADNKLLLPICSSLPYKDPTLELSLSLSQTPILQHPTDALLEILLETLPYKKLLQLTTDNCKCNSSPPEFSSLSLSQTHTHTHTHTHTAPNLTTPKLILLESDFLTEFWESGLNSVLSQQLSYNSFSFWQSKGTTRGLLALKVVLLAFAYQGKKDIVFRFIIEYIVAFRDFPAPR